MQVIANLFTYTCLLELVMSVSPGPNPNNSIYRDRPFARRAVMRIVSGMDSHQSPSCSSLLHATVQARNEPAQRQRQQRARYYGSFHN